MKPSTAPASQNLVKVKRAAGLVMRGVSEKEGLLSQRLGLKPLISLLILNLFSQLEGPFSLWRPSRVRFKRFSCRSHRKWCRNLTLDFPSMMIYWEPPFHAHVVPCERQAEGVPATSPLFLTCTGKAQVSRE